eukprot:6180634-Pleurochrysis_carterae.AAC.3
MQHDQKGGGLRAILHLLDAGLRKHATTLEARMCRPPTCPSSLPPEYARIPCHLVRTSGSLFAASQILRAQDTPLRPAGDVASSQRQRTRHKGDPATFGKSRFHREAAKQIRKALLFLERQFRVSVFRRLAQLALDVVHRCRGKDAHEDGVDRAEERLELLTPKWERRFATLGAIPMKRVKETGFGLAASSVLARTATFPSCILSVDSSAKAHA